MSELTVTVPFLQENLDELLVWLDSTKGQIFILNDDGEPTTVLISYDEAKYLGIIKDEDNEITSQ